MSQILSECLSIQRSLSLKGIGEKQSSLSWNLAQLSNLCKFDKVLCMLPSLELVVAEVTWTLWYGKSFEVSERVTRELLS
ncbi:hypothetical protein HGM15179_020024 [Zosterops borbonicus]|uniref:Uncharacterized protein n=1 Tax=Zosterops borbonicus TaxID=364589 RepID=A0A8K1D8U4_9PASS|nr:hypothetical protein HGM15179_020024 [Zosterops borbonicus]